MSKEFKVNVEILLRFRELIKADNEDDAFDIVQSILEEEIRLGNVYTYSDMIISIKQ